MIKMLKSKGRLLLFVLLTVCSLFLLGASKIDKNAKAVPTDEKQVIIQNLIECNSQLYKDSDVSWRKILQEKPMLMLRIEASE